MLPISPPFLFSSLPPLPFFFSLLPPSSPFFPILYGRVFPSLSASGQLLGRVNDEEHDGVRTNRVPPSSTYRQHSPTLSTIHVHPSSTISNNVPITFPHRQKRQRSQNQSSARCSSAFHHHHRFSDNCGWVLSLGCTVPSLPWHSCTKSY